MSVTGTRTRKSKNVEVPKVILETAVPEPEETSEINMRRNTSFPIDPENIPDGMKTPSKLEKEERAYAEYKKEIELADAERANKMFKLLAFGAAIATGAIIAYKVSGYLTVADEVADTIVEKTE